MAFLSGVASGIIELSDTLRSFAIAQGWTVNRWVDSATGKELCISRDDAFFNLRFYVDEVTVFYVNYPAYGVAISGSDGYDSGLDWNEQLNAPKINGNNTYAGCIFPYGNSYGDINYWFFSPTADVIYCELGITNNLFHRFGVGKLELIDSSADGGGRFYYGVSAGSSFRSLIVTSNIYSNAGEYFPFRAAEINSSNNSYSASSFLRVNIDGYDGWSSSGLAPSSSGLQSACVGSVYFNRFIHASQFNVNQSKIILDKNLVYVYVSEGVFSPVGYVPGMAAVDIKNIAPEQEITVSSENWQVFPLVSKGGFSYNRGIAYLKV